ncbi:MAG: hypothetical protein WAQ53_15620 [Thiofilum sp.]|uniref:hypothetical protein n=1 Tax=Thiofilum sp. TaxID=2212733 RepID=UPI0025EA43AA|nr:hypothetical protein [Thiofilum sp.]MBK8455435.1 hypothetical protein [Thiofilum sp.]
MSLKPNLIITCLIALLTSSTSQGNNYFYITPTTYNNTIHTITYHNTLINFNGRRLDWCLKWGTLCGKPAADAWCNLKNKSKLSVRAIAFEKAEDIGNTYVLKDKTTCNKPYCDGFELITCELYGE